MGHYDDYYEAKYAEASQLDHENRKAEIPRIILGLEFTSLRLRRSARFIEYADRIADDIQFAILALRGQVEH